MPADPPPTAASPVSAQLVAFRSFGVEVALGGLVPGDEGVLVAHGDAFGGHLLAVEDGRPAVLHDAGGRVSSADGPAPAGARTVVLSVTATPDLRRHPAVSAEAASRADRPLDRVTQ